MMSQHVAENVSVVSTSYNNASFLEDFFRSILRADVLPHELIIVDDCSTDYSDRIIRTYSEKHSWIKPVFLQQNVGVANARNIGNSQARGEYILILDSDDIMMADRIPFQLFFFERNPQTDVLGGNCWYIKGQAGSRIFRSNFPTSFDEIRAFFMRGDNGVLNGTTMVRRKWFERFQYRQEMVWAEDYDLFARMLHAGAVFAGQKEPHTLVRIHGESATSKLKFDTLKKAHTVSQHLFGNKRTLFSVWINYLHLRSYRNYLLADKQLQKCLQLSIALFFRPDKIFKRLRNASHK